MRRFIVFSPKGEATYTAIYSDPDQVPEISPDLGCVLEVPAEHYAKADDWFLENTYIKDGKLGQRSPRPNDFYQWDINSESWLPNLDAAKAAKKGEIEAELARRLYLPCNGFDADTLSRERISGMISRLQRGDPLPAGWVGWRDASNQQQWATDDAATVLANLTALSRAIEDREQALLIAAWQHKAAIAALTSVEALLAYDVTTVW